MAAAWAAIVFYCGLPTSATAQEPAAGVDRPAAAPYGWQLPKGFPRPLVPPDNEMSAAKVELGRHLFYDRRLSGNGTLSCGDCHRQELAFTDGRRRAIGATGEEHRRSAMSLANVAYSLSLNWADTAPASLETQLLTPLFGRHPVEMGLQRSPAVLRRLADAPTVARFRKAFPDDDPALTFVNLAKAIAAFQRTLLSGNAPFDRYWNHDESAALSPSQQRGMQLFFSKRLSCSQCHRRFNFSGPLQHEGAEVRRPELHNTGLYDLGNGAYPSSDQGLIEVTGRAEDMGRFRPPTLRNIAVTAPYMHDGSIATLEGVIAHYAAGGRTLTSGPDAGRGHANPWKSELLTGFTLTPEETSDLVNFLHSLTDNDFLTDPRFAAPKPPPPLEHSLQTARQAAEFPTPETRPFRRRATVSIRNGEARLDGSYTQIWQSPKRFRTSIRVGDYEEVRIAHGDQMTWLRNMGYAPRVIVELQRTLDFIDLLPLDEGEEMSPLPPRTIDGVSARCSRIRRPKPPDGPQVVCFTETGDLPGHSASPGGRTLSLGPWRSVDGHLLPVSLHRSIGKTIDIRVDFAPIVRLDDIEESTWTLKDPRAKTWGWCPKEQYVEARPKGRLPNLGVNVHLELDRRGRFSSVFIVGHGSTYQSSKLHQKVRAIRFDPATCNGRPVESEVFFSSGRNP